MSTAPKLRALRSPRGWLILAALAALIWLYFIPSGQQTLIVLSDSAQLKNRLDPLTHLGPMVIILLMAVAIIFNPIPSAPIALAAGAAYGHSWGTLYIVLGAEVGAIIAFGIGRYLGREALQKWFGDKISLGWWGNQNHLTTLVFISRLLPFVSFDLISYAAGLTCIRFWRFAFATLFGLIPISFLLAHFGSELATTELNRAIPIALGLGILTFISMIWTGLSMRKHKN